MVVSHVDPSLFVLQAIDGMVLVLIYIDNCLLAATSVCQLAPVLQAISNFWEMKGMGEPFSEPFSEHYHLPTEPFAVHLGSFLSKRRDSVNSLSTNQNQQASPLDTVSIGAYSEGQLTVLSLQPHIFFRNRSFACLRKRLSYRFAVKCPRQRYRKHRLHIELVVRCRSS